MYLNNVEIANLYALIEKYNPYGFQLRQSSTSGIGTNTYVTFVSRDKNDKPLETVEVDITDYESW